MKESLHLYGHNQPSVFYTDNMADKEFLKKCFSSLWEDVVPVEKYSSLELFAIPSNVHVAVLQSVDEINAAMQSILQLLPDSDAEGIVIIVLDSEWNVEVSKHDNVTGRGQTAILQIAFGREIYIIQASCSFHNPSLQ
jgi:hypothetical protein